MLSRYQPTSTSLLGHSPGVLAQAGVGVEGTGGGLCDRGAVGGRQGNACLGCIGGVSAVRGHCGVDDGGNLQGLGVHAQAAGSAVEHDLLQDVRGCLDIDDIQGVGLAGRHLQGGGRLCWGMLQGTKAR